LILRIDEINTIRKFFEFPAKFLFGSTNSECLLKSRAIVSIFRKELGVVKQRLQNEEVSWIEGNNNLDSFELGLVGFGATRTLKKYLAIRRNGGPLHAVDSQKFNS